MNNISIERLREVVDYDPETGIFTWKISLSNRVRIGDKAGYKIQRGYWCLSIDGIKIQAHRAAWAYVTGDWSEFQIDHENRIRDDNRFLNLRKATNSLNMANANKQSNNTSGYRGVVYLKDKDKWWVRVSKESIGVFASKIEAAIAYNEAARNKYGEFAYQNEVICL